MAAWQTYLWGLTGTLSYFCVMLGRRALSHFTFSSPWYTVFDVLHIASEITSKPSSSCQVRILGILVGVVTLASAAVVLKRSPSYQLHFHRCGICSCGAVLHR